MQLTIRIAHTSAEGKVTEQPITVETRKPYVALTIEGSVVNGMHLKKADAKRFAKAILRAVELMDSGVCE